MGRAYQNRKESMAKTAAAKTKVYSKYGREIYVVAKSGGADPDANLALRSLLDRAKKDQVPSHVIKNALDKAQGGAGEDFSPARYEGFGPGNCMVIVDCLTDNPNRTFGDVRLAFTKTNCKIGTQGSVSHMFDHSAIFVFDGDDEEAVLEALMMADVDVSDIECEDGKISVFAPHTEFFKTKQALQETFEGIDFDVEEIQFLPQTTAPISQDDMPMFEKFMDMLNELDDVQNIYHSAELPAD
ncbi:MULTISPECIES: YebC/PmpR family DNA-binding transcriptional regulator [Spongiibacter]|uniref:YebC/PmpR family DNA-binding transcriptional regulator n=1 Tax=Spongiibacter TaxID=630749 RepID=UPI000C0BA52F|nr:MULTISPECIES: YebC/PmpR family DNA-binding transcriptional regulator [Spongiibacter]MAK42629.1 YebC/PmpR family DNA-binding transcriptional regulator [Spongiibacter sp.]MBM7424585.1 YebC/PmpR family DNA-binding regulatory protein [Spongiibacter marinus]MEE2652194.1 YebC/PmpR family DNA-binding transcriptional regulator [Pseudomonadota bacterium]